MSRKGKKAQIDNEARSKMLEELKKKGIEIKDEDKITGGSVDFPLWLETPVKDDDPTGI